MLFMVVSPFSNWELVTSCAQDAVRLRTARCKKSGGGRHLLCVYLLSLIYILYNLSSSS